MRFGISTHLYHDQRLGPGHLAEVAAHGFMLVELFATRTHFDYHDPAAGRALRSWLTDAGLFLHSVHAPIVERLAGGVWGGPLSNAAADNGARERAVRESERALALAEEVPFEFLVVHLGRPDAQVEGASDNNPDAARRSLEAIHRAAARHGVRLALEVIPNRLSSVAALVELIEDLDLPDVGICLDYGHAFLLGDLPDAIERASGHLVTTHIHDNGGTADDHLVPFDGRIDWSTAVMTTQKVGYEGVWLLELGPTAPPASVLARAEGACRRFEDLVVTPEET